MKDVQASQLLDLLKEYDAKSFDKPLLEPQELSSIRKYLQKHNRKSDLQKYGKSLNLFMSLANVALAVLKPKASKN